MIDVFADTSYFIALLSPSDRHHHAARQATSRRTSRLVTTSWVVVEVANAMSRVGLRQLFLNVYDGMITLPQHLIIPADQKWIERGLEYYRQRPDKNWSLTDCISFIVMQELAITEALTADSHFQQAGFRALLLE